MNSISNEFASGELALPIPLRAALIDCISSSHFFTSSRAACNVIEVVVADSDMVEETDFCCFSCDQLINMISKQRECFWLQLLYRQQMVMNEDII